MFLKKRNSATRHKTATRLAFSVLGPDIALEGDLTATADLHLDGKIDGDIKCATLVQAETSEVIGMVVAESAEVAGKIRGSISAETLVILKTARIAGDVAYGTLTIEEGAQVEGNFSQTTDEPKLMLAGGTEAV